MTLDHSPILTTLRDTDRWYACSCFFASFLSPLSGSVEVIVEIPAAVKSLGVMFGKLTDLKGN